MTDVLDADEVAALLRVKVGTAIAWRVRFAPGNHRSARRQRTDFGDR